ncbi:hypothetical protein CAUPRSCDRAFT_13118 [Caulochytrium protostelioides]|uniref:Uncharacterized protein n=1 Tax=Caulochytrium protostelioides TaxID=1555241 RepID=A0A4P9WRA2_9FUNG|nr:hypothetical protein CAUPRSCDRAFT_13118 [Caulochytrium protostelioides]
MSDHIGQNHEESEKKGSNEASERLGLVRFSRQGIAHAERTGAVPLRAEQPFVDAGLVEPVAADELADGVAVLVVGETDGARARVADEARESVAAAAACVAAAAAGAPPRLVVRRAPGRPPVLARVVPRPAGRAGRSVPRRPRRRVARGQDPPRGQGAGDPVGV